MSQPQSTDPSSAMNDPQSPDPLSTKSQPEMPGPSTEESQPELPDSPPMESQPTHPDVPPAESQPTHPVPPATESELQSPDPSSSSESTASPPSDSWLSDPTLCVFMGEYLEDITYICYGLNLTAGFWLRVEDVRLRIEPEYGSAYNDFLEGATDMGSGVYLQAFTGAAESGTRVSLSTMRLLWKNYEVPRRDMDRFDTEIIRRGVQSVT